MAGHRVETNIPVIPSNFFIGDSIVHAHVSMCHTLLAFGHEHIFENKSISGHGSLFLKDETSHVLLRADRQALHYIHMHSIQHYYYVRLLCELKLAIQVALSGVPLALINLSGTVQSYYRIGLYAIPLETNE